MRIFTGIIEKEWTIWQQYHYKHITYNDKIYLIWWFSEEDCGVGEIKGKKKWTPGNSEINSFKLFYPQIIKEDLENESINAILNNELE